MEHLALTLRRAGMAVNIGDIAVHIPLDVINGMIHQQARQALGQIVDHFRSGQIQHQLVAAHCGLSARQRKGPIRMRTIQIRILVDHLRLNPNAKAHVHGMHASNQIIERSAQLLFVDHPIAEACIIVLHTAAEPAIVQHHHIHAQLGSLLGDCSNLVAVEIKICRFPVVDQHRTRGKRILAAHDVGTDKTVVATGKRADTFMREGKNGFRRMESFTRVELPGKEFIIDAGNQTRFSAEIHLDIRAMAAGIHLHHAKAIALRLSRTLCGKNHKRIVVMAGCTAAGRDCADSAGERHALHLALHLMAAMEMQQFPLAARHIQAQRHRAMKRQGFMTLVGQARSAGDDVLLFIHAIEQFKLQPSHRITQNNAQRLRFIRFCKCTGHAAYSIFIVQDAVALINKICAIRTAIRLHLNRRYPEIASIAANIFLGQQIRRNAALNTEVVIIR